MKTTLTIVLTFLSLINCFSQSQNQKLVNDIHKRLGNCDFYEVSEEMFRLISEDERYQNAENIEYLKKINYIIYVQCEDKSIDFYTNFISEADLKEFKVLMRSISTDEKFQFLLKKSKDINEYLLVHSDGLSYIVTSLNISTLNEMSGILNIVGELGPN